MSTSCFGGYRKVRSQFRIGMCHESGLLRQPARAGTGTLLQLRLGGDPCESSAALTSGRALRMHVDCGRLVQGLGEPEPEGRAPDRASHRLDRRARALPTSRDANGFEPDIIIGFAGQANYLARLWPSALRLHIERGHFGRDPYPFSMYFDHVGTHARSAVARAGGLKLAYPLTSDGRTLVSAFRSQMAAAFDCMDPFRTQTLRKRFDRLCLLPLQVSNEFSFDGLVGYRTQFEYLYDILAAAPKDVAVIVTEHPNGDP